MSFWRGETLLDRLPKLGLIEPFREDAIDCASYTLRIGSEIYITPDGAITNPDTHTKRQLGKGEGFTIPPGQFAFLLTEETVMVPNHLIAFISIKARKKFKGLINISGFHVDPGYEGKLLFSVLNAGPKALHLQQGLPLFLIWYAELDGVTELNKSNNGFDHIEPDLVDGISGEILSLQSLSSKQRELDSRIKQLERRKKVLGNIKRGVAIGVIVLLIAWVGSKVWSTFSGKLFAKTLGDVQPIPPEPSGMTLDNDSKPPARGHYGPYGRP